MKFEGSLQEIKYNKYWDGVVVACDNKIKRQFSYTPAFTSMQPSLGNIAEYAHHVTNVVQNLLRQSVEYTDKGYIASYIADTKEQAIGDLNHYKTLLDRFQFGRYKDNIPSVDRLIDAINALPNFFIY